MYCSRWFEKKKIKRKHASTRKKYLMQERTVPSSRLAEGKDYKRLTRVFTGMRKISLGFHA
jgi:hypothetical protein